MKIIKNGVLILIALINWHIGDPKTFDSYLCET